MKLKNIFLCAFVLWLVNSAAQTHFPGGVPGSEAWYIVNHNELSQLIYPNHGMSHIVIKPCPGSVFSGNLLNFNHTIASTNLCLQYDAPLENTASRNIFFVGQAKVTPNDISHVTTDWRGGIAPGNLPEGVTSIRNRFDLGLKTLNIDKLFLQYSSNNNVNINFYNWNIYQTDRKFKSYGYTGETTFYIGKNFQIIETEPDINAIDFVGDFPEYISFPFELTANERNRVQSYLALKYGITLVDSELSYRNSKNIIFWDSTNNPLFHNRIFGVGRDDISGLNQLESQSSHRTDYLIASVEKLVETNLEKQELVEIEDNNHFIVFGDNNGSETLGATNYFNVRPLNRKWLSQNTGKNSSKINMFFKFNIHGDIEAVLSENPSLKLWMLHDKYVTNQEVSDFNSQYVEYYDPVNIEGNYAYFEEVYFDPDKNIYDQYTFGVGPEMIAQIRLDADCETEKPKATLVITGGKAPYSFKIFDTNGFFKDGTINENTFSFETYPPETYTVYVMDSNGIETVTIFDIVHYQLIVDLGSDVTLSASQPQVTLDAGAGVADPDATYQWYLDGELISNEYASSLTVDETGEYRVVVTSGNRSCIVEDIIIVSYNFTGTIEGETPCNTGDGSITVTISGGVAPFITVISKPAQNGQDGLTISQVHSIETSVFSNIGYGQYTVITTDNLGNVFQGTVLLENPLEGIEQPSVIAQLQGMCQENSSLTGFYFFCDEYNNITIDASISVTNPDVSYEWFMNGNTMNIYSPVVQLMLIDGNNDPETGIYLPTNEFVIKITNLKSNCYTTETFYLIKSGYITEASQPSNTRMTQSTDTEQEPEPTSWLDAKVYPNPSRSGITFYYEVSSSKAFQGTVEIYTPSGAILQQIPISGKSSYTLPLSLITAGVYFICTKTEGKILTDKVIIR